MGRPMTPLERLGRAVADDLDGAGRRLDAVALARSRVVARVPLGRPSRSHRGTVAAVGFFGLAALVTAVVLVLRRPSPLTFTVGEERDSTPWLSATAQSIPVLFSDGTRLVLEPKSSARLVGVNANGAEIVLEAGLATASVKHRAGSRWRLHAGPYEVQVTGTKFKLGWDPAQQEMSLAMEEGQVVVSGCGLGTRTVSAGESFHATCGSPSTPSTAPSASANGGPHNAEPDTLASARPATAEVAESGKADVRSPGHATEAPSWQRLAALGRYSEAFAAAQRVGLDSTSQRAAAPELLALADVERLSGHSDLAESTLGTIRRRFAGSPAAATAAFHLGRIAFDQRGAYASAGSYLTLYLREQPNGPLAREAAGRVIEARQRGSDILGARAAAAAYIVSFPDGPHAALARSLVQP